MLVVVRKERKLVVMQAHEVECTPSDLTLNWLESWVRADFSSLGTNSLIITELWHIIFCFFSKLSVLQTTSCSNGGINHKVDLTLV